MTLAQPLWLLLLLLLPLLMYQYKREARQRHVTLQVSRLKAMKGIKTWVVYARNWIQLLRWATLTVVIIAMARPQLRWQEETIEAEAIDIMLVMDLSPSMLSKDFQPDRLSIAKELASGFIKSRPYDQLGLVVFSGGAFTQCPLSNDRRILLAFVNNLQVGRLPDGSAIGMGIATAVQHLDKSESKSKIVLLLTDGENNAGDLEPLKAAAIAKALGVRIYPIGIGTDGMVLSPSFQNRDGTFAFATRQMSFDATLLKEIASISQGKYYRAQNTNDLDGIYKAIESLEKTKVKRVEINRTTELFFWFINAAFCLLILELLLRWGPLRVITV